MKLQWIKSAAGMLGAAMLLTVCAAPVFADTDEEQEVEIFTSGDYTYSLMVGAANKTEKAACIESYKGEIEPYLVLPDTLDGYPVVALGDTALTQCPWLVDVTLPASMVGVGNATFAGCTRLENYYVAEGNDYFESIDGVLYAEDGTYLVRYPIGRNETEITVPDGVYDIGYVAFGYSNTLETIHLPDSLCYIGAWAFAECKNLNHVEIPKKVEEIEDFVFYRCKSLDDVTLPKGIKAIGDAAFAGTALKEFTIPEKCVAIGQATFAGTPMDEVTIPATVTSIDFSAFGWLMDQQGQLYANTDFIIHGVRGTVAEQYAKDKENGNLFTFVEIENTTTTTTQKNPASITTAATGSQGSSGMSTGRLIGVIVCVVLLIGVVIGGVMWAKKK